MRKGFTLIELIMVIVIIGVLAAVALPRFVNLQVDARQAATKGALGAIRSAIVIDYARSATSGNAVFPATIDGSLFAAGKVPSETVSVLSGNNAVVTSTNNVITGTGGWLYMITSSSAEVYVNHPSYSSY